MKKTRVLYVSQEIIPFLPKNEISERSRSLPQQMQEKGKEIRVFMPRFGSINERRHQLHEVIRLSGMNLVINDTDHPLIIKVASIPSARMQVYFIDNEDYFHRKSVFANDKSEFPDNDERSMFFCRGVLETVKKLGWAPDVIHCHGWFTALMPLYLKKVYNEDPHFQDSKIVFSAYKDGFKNKLSKNVIDKLSMDGINKDDIDMLKDPTFANLNELAFKFADGIIQGSKEIDPAVAEAINKSNKPTLGYYDHASHVKPYAEFYDAVLEENPVLAD